MQVAAQHHRNGLRGAKAAVIDAHVHVCVLDPDRYPWQPLLGYIPRAAAPVESLLARMDACGVDAAVCVQPSYYGYDNRYLQEALGRDRRRLRGVGLADPFAPLLPEALVGMRLNAVGHSGPGWLAQTAAAGFWDQVAARGWVLCAQCAPDQVAEFARLAAAHPGLPCVLDHLGRGAWGDVLAGASVPNLYLKVSGLAALSAEPYPHRDLWPAVQAAISAYGPQRCLFGTDASATALPPYAAQVDLWREHLPLTAEQREAILGGTAHRLFFQGRGG